MSIQVEGRDIGRIAVWDGTRFRNVIGKIMTADGLKDFYRPINFKDDFIMQTSMSRYTVRSFIKSALNIGETTIPVQSVTGFFVGQEITIDDGINTEDVGITGINGNNLVTTPTTQNYKMNASAARSTAVFNEKFSFEVRKTFSISIS